MNAPTPNLDDLDAYALREQVRALMAQLGKKNQLLANKRQEMLYEDTKIAQLTHEIAGLRRYQFDKTGEHAAAVMTLIQSAKLNGHDPYVYLEDVLTRLPTQPASCISELLPQN